MKTVKTILVGKGALMLRSSGDVYWVRDLEAARNRGGSSFARYDHGVLLVTSAPGCDALKEMAPAVRKLR